MLIAIIGRQGCGKSTLFDAITGLSGIHKHTERHGVIKVPDERLDFLHERFHPEAKKTNATIEFLDTGKMDFSREELRNAAGYLFVVNGFLSKPDPEKELRFLREEMILKDLEIVERRLQKISKAYDETSVREKKALSNLKSLLEEGKTVADAGELPTFLRGFSFSSGKPVICIVNILEGEEVREEIIEGIPVLYVQGKLQKEIAELPDEERKEFYREMGIEKPITETVIKTVYREMGLITFYTMNRKEVRAWSIPDGATAKKAAGVIHSDMEKGFIRAEVISFDDLKRAGDEKKAKDLGLYRVEGKDYIVKDGDILFIRFSV